MKFLLSVIMSISLNMLYGELGRYPVSLNVKLRMITFWLKLITGKRTKLAFLIYELLLLIIIMEYVGING